MSCWKGKSQCHPLQNMKEEEETTAGRPGIESVSSEKASQPGIININEDQELCGGEATLESHLKT